MGITTNCLSVVAANMSGSAIPTMIAIGTGSSTFASGQTDLLSETDRNQINTYDLTNAKEITLISNWSPSEISGTILREFGTFTSGDVMLNREILNGSLVFTGDEELQIQQTFRFYT